MANGNRQYDPVAASAQAALDATERGIRSANRNFSVPRPPAQQTAFNGARNAIDSLSEFSPANLALSGNGPSPPEGLPGPDPQSIDQQISGVLPSSIPTPMELMGGGGSSRPSPSPPSNGGSGSGGSGNGGSSGSSNQSMSSGGGQFSSM
jgi:hypothetical protein